MSRLEELMADIVANPGDDAPRRVYADALLDRGDPYGEFINVQLDLVRDDLPREDRIRRRLRELELLRDHGRRWTSGLADAVMDAHFRRGFLDEATVPVDMLTSEGLRAAMPLLRVVTMPILDVTLRDGLAWVDKLLASPIVQQLEGVRLYLERAVDPVDDEPFQIATAAFAEAANCGRLVALRIPPLRNEPLRRFVNAELLSRLVWIDVSAQVPEHAWAIIDAIPSGQLRGVRLDWRWMDPLLHESLRSLALRAGSRSSLVRAIGNAIAFEGMHELDLGVTDWEAVRELAHARQLDSLRVLRLQGHIEASEIGTLIDWPIVQRLEVLDLRGVDAATFQRDELASRFDGILLLGSVRTGALGGCW